MTGYVILRHNQLELNVVLQRLLEDICVRIRNSKTSTKFNTEERTFLALYNNSI